MLMKLKINLARLGAAGVIHRHLKAVQPLISVRAVTGKGVASFLFLAVFLWLQALSASPDLHASFHADAPHADHHCAVTLLSHGQIDAAGDQVPVILPALVTVEIFQSQPLLPCSVDYRLLPGRAPPLCS